MNQNIRYKLIPVKYQEDTPESRKESRMDYERMYHEEYVKELFEQINDLTDCLHGAIMDSQNRGTQRMCIPVIRKSHQIMEEWKKK